MFGLGKKATTTKSKLTDHQKSELADLLAKMLAMQMATTILFAPALTHEITRIEFVEGKVNRKAIGYIYGFIDAAIQCSEDDNISDVHVGPPILYHVLRKLFPGHERDYMEFLMNHEDDELVMLGKLAGGQQYLDFIQKRDAKGAPMGFARFIVDGREE